ncbi:MAG: hypothetical protein IT166_18900 [Bryobacterales bacterium]|nr:hypothetical protein [Bryobacterales bacterium]
MKTVFSSLLLALALAAGVGNSTLAAAGCGIKPIKPITPIGCKDLVAQCTCDAQGNRCHWQWICVKR